jgi:hypothetical protein
MEITINSMHQDIVRLRNEVELLKRIMCEGELTDWAKGELVKARAEPISLCISQEDLRSKILKRGAI